MTGVPRSIAGETSVLVPAYNEEDVVRQTVSALQELGAWRQLLVIDDGSTDQTAHAAQAGGAEVLRLEQNAGKSAAVALGLKRISSELLLLADADLGQTAQHLGDLLLPVWDQETAMTIGVPTGTPAASGGLGLAVNTARWLVKTLVGLELQAPLSGQRAMRTQWLRSCQPLAEGFGLEIWLDLMAGAGGTAVKEVQLPIGHRWTGRDLAGFYHRGIQYRDMLAASWRFCWQARQRGEQC